VCTPPRVYNIATVPVNLNNMREDEPTLYLVAPSTPNGGTPAYKLRTPQQLGVGEA
jgi:hypothetical protein